MLHCINSNEKIFFIEVGFEEKMAKLQPQKEDLKHFFTFSEAQKRLKQIRHLFKGEKWATYFDVEVDELRYKIISEFINYQ